MLKLTIDLYFFKKIIFSPSAQRGWELLLLCTSFFSPTAVFDPYLRKFLQIYSVDKQTEFHDFAKRCENRLKLVKKNGTRKSPPNADEVLAAQVFFLSFFSFFFFFFFS